MLEGWLEAAKAAKEAVAAEAQVNEGPVRVIFDTDIGTDGMKCVVCGGDACDTLTERGRAGAVDDALALLMLLHLPKEDVELLGITTTYGYTQVRGWLGSNQFFWPSRSPSHMSGARARARAVVRVRCVCDVGSSCVCGACAMWGRRACAGNRCEHG